ncbi:MAG: T9SS type A sorting domain-containing protein, partial [Candidatus Eisenbacteria bacterium]|nr:T9SS type A sorting domain-containing protein [Candidatus Eisenbacteria bacterium]
VAAGDEPAQVAFLKNPAGGPQDLLAAITLSSEDRVVFHRDTYPFERVAAVEIPGADPRALAVDSDSLGLWVAVFESGNRSTVVWRMLVPSGPWGGLPPLDPPLDPELPPVPDIGVIVRKTNGMWLDEQGGNWNDVVTWDLPDIDLVHIDISGPEPAIDRTVSGVGTLLYDLAIDERNGDIWVVNTEALNEILFEPKLRGIGVENHITHVPAGDWTPATHDLNPPAPGPQAPQSGFAGAQAGQILAVPNEVLLSDFNGGFELYVTAIGGDHLAVVDPATGSVVRRIPAPEGLTGVVESPGGNLLVALNRLQNSLHVVDPLSGATGAAVPIGKSGFDPTPEPIRNGRRFLYTGAHSLNGSFACASCHPHAHLDGLSWDLGDPTGELEQLPAEENGGVEIPPFHPVKGPMATQSLRGLEDAGRLHWRGDRSGFARFNPAFESLMGGDTLSAQDMLDFEDFIMAVRYPPNPWRDHLNQLPPVMPNGGDPSAGKQVFEDPLEGDCLQCHAMPLGTDGIVVPQNDEFIGDQAMKTPQLRGLHEKLGFRGFDAVDNKRGIGFMHDGFDPDLWEFLEHQEEKFDESFIPDVEAYVLAFSTETHGGVGRQVTLDATLPGDPDRQQRLADLLEAVESGGVDLIVHGSVEEGRRGWLWIDPGNGGLYQSDRAGEIWTHGEIYAAAVEGPALLTMTAVVPGQGVRMGIDRDGDGFYDLDEIDSGSDPADPGSLPAAGVGDEDPGVIAAVTRITSLFPNPAPDDAQVELYLGAASPVEVSVHDIRGRRVATLAAGRFAAGRHTLDWNGANSHGASVAPGVYFVRLETPYTVRMRKLTRF